MATLGANAIVQKYGLTYAGGGFGWMTLGVGLLAVGGLVDGKMMQGLFGSGRSQWTPPRLVGLPVQSGESGQPRIWAIGRRLRVPVHTAWQSSKTITQRAGGGLKAPASGNMNRVLVDCALAVNDRETQRITQLIGQGSMIFWTERSIVFVRTSGMTVSESGGQLVLAMVDTFEPDWTEKFEADDLVTLRGFVTISGPSINFTGYWRVVSATAHTASTPSTLTLAPYSGQSLVGLNSTAGTPSSPAEVIRADASVVSHTCSFVSDSITAEPHTLVVSPSYGTAPNAIFQGGDKVRLQGFGGGASVLNGIELTVLSASATTLSIDVRAIYLGGGAVAGPSAGTSTNAAIVTFWSTSTFSTGMFPVGFVPADHFYRGTLTQDPDATIEAVEGVGDVSAYRGIAYQVLDDWDVTAFGGQVPAQLEAIIDPDQALTWADAFLLVAVRCGIPENAVDTSGVYADPFEGFYIRGPQPGAQSLQSLLLAAQVATQERNGVLCFFAIPNADVVRIQNGATFSDFVIGSNGDKLQFGDPTPEDLPTSVGVRHQDPDNYYADGYQFHGLRHPSAAGDENRQEVDLSNVVLTRKQAANLAATLMRRAYVNSREVSLELSAAYLHVLENDLLTVTDDDGNDHTIRVTRREIGSNYLVRIVGVIEDVDLDVSGSPAQPAAGNTTPPPTQLAPIVGRVLDMPPLRDVDGRTPALLLAAGPVAGGNWAGCSVHRSVDAGANWNQVGTIGQVASVGTTTDTLDAATPSEALGSSTLTWDASGSVTVEFDAQGLLPLATSTESSVQQGVNWLLLDSGNGDLEVIGARDVTQNTATNYTFSHLLRGLRGTIAGCANDRAPGASVTVVSFLPDLGGLVLDSAGVAGSPVQEFRFVPPGADVTDVASVPITATWRNCRPFPVRDVTKTINGTTSVRFEVDHWSRAATPPGTVGPYPLDESYETYRFDLWNASRTAIVYRRTITAVGTGARSLRDKWVDFTAAEVNAAVAGYTLGPGETFWIDVVQVGDFGESPSNLQEL